jgi:hypothetical protein
MAKSSGHSWIRRPRANWDQTVGAGDAPGRGEDDGGDEKAGEEPWAEESKKKHTDRRGESATVRLIRGLPARFLAPG